MFSPSRYVQPKGESQMATWHVVSNEEGQVLAVYGEALLSEAQEKCRRLEREFGLPIYLHSGTYADGNRPRVGQTISMKNAVTRWTSNPQL